MSKIIMEHTCNFKECAFAKKIKLKQQDECPLFIKNYFTPIDKLGNEGNPILVNDCSPRRTMLMVQEVLNRLISSQGSIEQLRNQNVSTNMIARDLLNSAQKAIDQNRLGETN